MILHYENTRDVWVEPVAGSIVGEEDQPHRLQLAQGESDSDAVTTLEVKTACDETIAELADQASRTRNSILWGTRYGPVLGDVTGVLLLLLSGALMRFGLDFESRSSVCD